MTKQKSIGFDQKNRKPPPEIPKDMRDLPHQAQAKSFFRCQFGHDKKALEEEIEALKKIAKEKNKAVANVAPHMGCVVCKA